MPIKRLQKTRDTLPSGYQYGDARDVDWDARYVQPVREMYADPVKYAAYRARVEEALNTPVEQARAKGVEVFFRQFAR